MIHKKQWEFLRNKFEIGQLSHAYLFSGEEGIGKKDFAVELTKMVNCKDKENAPCQKCFSCQAIEKGNFPDLKVISEANAKDHLFGDGTAYAQGFGGSKGEIKIAQVRDVQNFLSYKSYYGDYKAVIMDGAEKMNQEAQSCFLKTLEEPKGKTLLFLITSKPDMLLATIASRCQMVKFFKPKGFEMNEKKAEKERQILKDLIGVINSDFADKFKYTKSINFTEQDPVEIINVLQKYFRKQLLNDFSDKKAKKVLELAEEINNKLVFTNANPKLALEVLLMEL
ncbi:MAG: DNA polymerase III subunit [Candidatus Staskawiczbacteria bacterium]|nr:DNA polymerase III subunit [Candidatus Staskawiczbacteria bacterium]